MSAITRFVVDAEPYWKGNDGEAQAFRLAREAVCIQFDEWRSRFNQARVISVRTESAHGRFQGQNWVAIEVLHE